MSAPSARAGPAGRRQLGIEANDHRPDPVAERLLAVVKEAVGLAARTWSARRACAQKSACRRQCQQQREMCLMIVAFVSFLVIGTVRQSGEPWQVISHLRL